LGGRRKIRASLVCKRNQGGLETAGSGAPAKEAIVGGSKAFLLILTSLLVLAIACSDDDDDGAATEVRGARSMLCDNIGDLENALSEADSLNASSTVDDAKQAQEDVKSATDAVVESAANVNQAELDALQSAEDAMNEAVDSLPSDGTLGEAATSLTSQASQVKASVDKIQSDAGCSPS
jgi:hypothetical protein